MICVVVYGRLIDWLRKWWERGEGEEEGNGSDWVGYGENEVGSTTIYIQVLNLDDGHYHFGIWIHIVLHFFSSFIVSVCQCLNWYKHKTTRSILFYFYNTKFGKFIPLEHTSRFNQRE